MKSSARSGESETAFDYEIEKVEEEIESPTGLIVVLTIFLICACAIIVGLSMNLCEKDSLIRE